MKQFVWMMILIAIMLILAACTDYDDEEIDSSSEVNAPTNEEKETNRLKGGI